MLFVPEMEFKYTYACIGGESYSIISSKKSKTKLSSNQNKISQPYLLRSMCDNFKCYILNVVHACFISEYGCWTLVSLFFSAISISIFIFSKYYFYTSSSSDLPRI